MSIQDNFLKLTKLLYPTGRAMKVKEDGDKDKMHRALAKSEARFWEDALSIRDGILPDNSDFGADDATAWERRLGLVTNEAVPLVDRKLAIERKYNHPGTVPARENYRFVEKQLRDAGFNVYVHENRFSDGMGGYYTQNPLVLSGGIGAGAPQHGDFQHGDQQHGSYYSHLIVNYLDEDKDSQFDIGTNLKSTFFIGGPYVGQFANVSLARKPEFRQLILRAKPVQTVGFLFINYI